MHIAEGILPLEQALLWTAVALPWVAWGLRESRAVLEQGAPEQRALLALTGALTFAITLLPVPVPVAGATSHLCATPVLGLLLGPSRVIFPTFLVLLLQALFFAHGGITTLGANTLMLGVLAPFAARLLLTLGRRLGLSRALAVGVACGLADALVYVADAGVVSLALSDERTPLAWAGLILLGFAPIQLPLAVVEGAVSAALVSTLERRQHRLLPPYLRLHVGSWLLAGGLLAGGLLAGGLLAGGLLLSPGALTAQEATPAEMRPLPSHPRVDAQVADPPTPTDPARLAPLEPSDVIASQEQSPSYQGLDEVVLSAVATQGGRPAQAPWLDLEDSELGRALLMLASFSAGMIAHAAWQRLVSRPLEPNSRPLEPNSPAQTTAKPPPQEAHRCL